MLRRPEVGGFVEDFGSVGEDHEAVCETGGNPEHFAIGGAQSFSHPLAEGGRIAAEIDGDVVDFSPETADEFSLGLLDLVVETTHHALVGEGLIVLNEGTGDAHVRQNPLIVAFEKRTPAVFEHLWFEKLHIGNFGRYEFI